MRNRNIKIILGLALAILAITTFYVRENYHQSSDVMSSDFECNDNNGFKTSAFVKFSGNDYYDISFKNIEELHYSYSSKLDKGEIILSLIVNNKEIWSSDKLKEEKNDSGNISVASGDDVKLRVIGKKATGTYRFEWEGK